MTNLISSINTATTAMTNLTTTFTSWGALPPRPVGSCDWHILLVMALGDQPDADPDEYTLLWHPATCHASISSARPNGLKYECGMEYELDNNGYSEFELEAGLYFVRTWCEKISTMDGTEWDAGVEQIDVIEFMRSNPPPI